MLSWEGGSKRESCLLDSLVINQTRGCFIIQSVTLIVFKSHHAYKSSFTNLHSMIGKIQFMKEITTEMMKGVFLYHSLRDRDPRALWIRSSQREYKWLKRLAIRSRVCISCNTPSRDWPELSDLACWEVGWAGFNGGLWRWGVIASVDSSVQFNGGLWCRGGQGVLGTVDISGTPTFLAQKKIPWQCD